LTLGSCVLVNNCWGIFRPHATVFCTITFKGVPNFATCCGIYCYLQLSFECTVIKLLKLVHFKVKSSFSLWVFVVSYGHNSKTSHRRLLSDPITNIIIIYLFQIYLVKMTSCCLLCVMCSFRRDRYDIPVWPTHVHDQSELFSSCILLYWLYWLSLVYVQ
jgi:hypothetical protein